MYVYHATIVKIHDADTVQTDVNLGFRTWQRGVWARVAGISCRELHMPGGREAADYVSGLLPAGTPTVVASIKVDHDPAEVTSFDRYVMSVQLPDYRDLAHLLLAEGWAVPWDGKSHPAPYPVWPIP